MNPLKPIGRWLIGFLFGTALVGVTSPLFVRSYAARVVDPVRKVVTYLPGTTYRWRSEGFATTKIGPHGMPGQSFVDQPSVNTRVALWGDSQVEGVALPDDQKLFAMLQDRLPGSLVYPLARSGEDASIWLPQMRRVEDGLKIDAHIVVIVDADDLLAAGRRPASKDPSEDQLPNLLSKMPSFIVHAASNLLRDPTDGTLRELRFHIGPTSDAQDPSESSTMLANEREGTTGEWLANLQAATEKPLWIVFAPRVPEISDGRIRMETSDAERRGNLQAALTIAGVHWIDVGTDFRASAMEGDWPHGFNNGRIGVGHLNATGYAILSDRISDAVRDSMSFADPTAPERE